MPAYGKPDELAQATREVAAAYIAGGVDAGALARSSTRARCRNMPS